MSLIGALAKAAKAGETAKKTAPFFSAVDEALAAIKRPKGTGAEFFTELSKQPGVKKAELADRKLEQAFKAKGKISKQEAEQILKENPPPQIKEKVINDLPLDEDEFFDSVAQEMYGKPYDKIESPLQQDFVFDEAMRRMELHNRTQYDQYKTAGGENYREILLKLPEEATPNPYYTSHWGDDSNVLAHMRVQDRTGPSGEKILHVEEIQSDWHQTGRKSGYHNEAMYQEARQKADEVARAAGFNDALHAAEGWKGHGMPSAKEASDLYDAASKFKSVNAVPDAPFKKNWHELAMKRLLNYAADNGYDSIAITPGAEQANRYKLSQQVNKIDYFKNEDGTFNFVAYSKQNHPLLHKTDVGFDQLGNYLGGEVAQKISEAAGAPRPTNLAIGKIGNNYEIIDQWGETVEKFKTKRDAEAKLGQITSGAGSLSGIDLDVGGEGMKGFYDKMLPDYLNNFGKPYGAQVQPLAFDVPVSSIDPRTKMSTTHSVHNFPITPQMREQIQQKGLPLYQQVGIPTAGAGAASQMLEPEEEAGLAGGGSIAKMAALAKLAKLKEEMTPRAEAVKALIARDENNYLRDVVPNSLTNAEIEAEIARMKAKAEASQPEVKKADGGAINYNTVPDMTDGERIIQGAPFKRGGKVKMTTNRDTMFLELSNKKLKRK
jgi:hypothetical protein